MKIVNNQYSLVLIFGSLLKKETKKSPKNLMSFILLPPPALTWLPHPAPSSPASRPPPAPILPGSRPPVPLHFVDVYMHSLKQPYCLNVGRLMINILHFKIPSSTNHIASFAGFFQGLWPRSRQEALGTRLAYKSKVKCFILFYTATDSSPVVSVWEKG